MYLAKILYKPGHNFNDIPVSLKVKHYYSFRLCCPKVWSGILENHQCYICFVCSALEFLSTCKLANLTVKAELGCCLLHRSGRLTIDGCVLQCESNPLDYLSCPIVSTARSCITPTPLKSKGDSVSVLQTRIEGGAKAVLTSGDLVLQRVRVIYARTYLYFWFDVDIEHQ